MVPDVAYVTNERLRGLTGEDLEVPPLAPDIAVEVRSKGNRETDIADKIATYLAAGTSFVLDVDPDSRTIVAHDASGVRTYAEGETFTHEAAPGLVIDIAELFTVIDPPR